jgi:hypothetical protein
MLARSSTTRGLRSTATSTSPSRSPGRKKLPKTAARVTEYKYSSLELISCTRFMNSESALMAVSLLIRLAAEARMRSPPASVEEYPGKGLLLRCSRSLLRRTYPANCMAFAISFARRRSYRNVSDSQSSRNPPPDRRRISRIRLAGFQVTPYMAVYDCVGVVKGSFTFFPLVRECARGS